MLDSGNGLTSFGEDTGFTASVESIFENLSPAILSAKDQMFSPWESADLSRVEFEEQGGLEGKSNFLTVFPLRRKCSFATVLFLQFQVASFVIRPLRRK